MKEQYKHLSVAEMDSELLERLERKFGLELDKEEYVHVYKTAKDFVEKELSDRAEYVRTEYYFYDDQMAEEMYEVLVQSDKLVKELAFKLAQRVCQDGTYYQVYVDDQTGQFVKFATFDEE